MRRSGLLNSEWPSAFRICLRCFRLVLGVGEEAIEVRSGDATLGQGFNLATRAGGPFVEDSPRVTAQRFVIAIHLDTAVRTCQCLGRRGPLMSASRLESMAGHCSAGRSWEGRFRGVIKLAVCSSRPVSKVCESPVSNCERPGAPSKVGNDIEIVATRLIKRLVKLTS